MIVGHSERRQLFGENDETVNKKVKAVFAHGMTPIVCVRRDARGARRRRDRVEGAAQVKRAFDGVAPDDAAAAVIAYEPIWAIGTGRNAEPSDAGQVDRPDPRHDRRGVRRHRRRRASGSSTGEA